MAAKQFPLHTAGFISHSIITLLAKAMKPYVEAILSLEKVAPELNPHN
jgi:hypothetical protein